MLRASLHGLGFAAQTDFTCFKTGTSIYACRGRNKDVRYAFETLQSVVKQVMALLAANGKLAVPANPSAIVVDGDIGNTTATATQIVVASFLRNNEIAQALTKAGVATPSAVNAILADNLTSQQLVTLVASGASDISGFLKYVAENFPVITRDPVVIEVPEPRMKITPLGVVVVGSTALVAVGLLASVLKNQVS